MNGKELRILLLEDVPSDAELNQRELRKGGIPFTARVTDTREGFMKALEDFRPDLILSDYKLPGFTGLDALAITHEKHPDIPFILVTGTMGEENAVESVKKGASDYVLKDKLFRLVPAVQRALEEANKRAELRQAEEALKENEEKYRVLTETAIDAIIGLKTSDVITLWNRGAEKIFGYSKEEAIGGNLHDMIVAGDCREKAYAGMRKFFETGEGPLVGKTIEVPAIRKDGTEFPVELSISAVMTQGQWHATGIIRDISERKKLEAELKEKLDVVERMNKLMVGRELRMEELKQENRRLKARLEELEKR